MATKAARAQQDILRAVRDANAINYDALAKAVGKLGPEIGTLAGGPVEDDYFIKFGDSFFHIFKLDEGIPSEEIAQQSE